MTKPLQTEEGFQAFERWRKHLDAVRDVGGVSEGALSLSRAFVTIDGIGFDQGEIRPDEKLGQWDMYFALLQGGVSGAECLILSGLSASEVADEKRREEIKDYGLDPDDPHEVAEHDRLQNMSPEELDAEIARLERALET